MTNLNNLTNLTMFDGRYRRRGCPLLAGISLAAAAGFWCWGFAFGWLLS